MKKFFVNYWMTLVVVSWSLGFSVSAHAAIITTYTNLSAWQAAAGSPIVVEDFTDSALVAGFSTTSGSISGGVFSDGALPGLFPSPGTLNFSPGTTAFGADWDLSPGGSGAGILFTAVFADSTTQIIGSIFNPSSNIQFQGFFGFVSDTAVTGVKYQSNSLMGSSELFNMDNASFRGANGGGGTVPEPSTILLLSPGLLGFGFFARKRMKG